MTAPTPGADESATDADGPVEWRPWTVPNVITMGRLALVPVFVWVLFGLEDRFLAACLLGVMGVSDGLDGQIARRFDQVSELGKLLDPIADRVLLITSVVSVLVDGSMPLWVGLLIVVREVFVSAAGLALAALGARRMEVTFLGKTAAFFNMFAFPFFLAGNSDIGAASVFEVLAWVCAAIGIGVGYWSVVDYVPKARAALAEGRESRSHGSGAPLG